MKEVARAVMEKHVAGTQTLVVVNTVDRAKAVYAELEKLRKKSATPRLLLVHSRFRPQEREVLNRQLQAKGKPQRIASSWRHRWSRPASIFRAARSSPNWPRGRASCSGSAAATAPATTVRAGCFWVDLDDDNQAAPYEPMELRFAREQLAKLDGREVSPKALESSNEISRSPCRSYTNTSSVAATCSICLTRRRICPATTSTSSGLSVATTKTRTCRCSGETWRLRGGMHRRKEMNCATFRSGALEPS